MSCIALAVGACTPTPPMPDPPPTHPASVLAEETAAPPRPDVLGRAATGDAPNPSPAPHHGHSP